MRPRAAQRVDALDDPSGELSDPLRVVTGVGHRSTGHADAGDGVEFRGALLEQMGVSTQIVGGAVELVLVHEQGRSAQQRTRSAPGVVVGELLQTHHGRRFDRGGERAQVICTLAELG